MPPSPQPPTAYLRLCPPQATIAEAVKLAVRDAKEDDVAEVASLLPPRQAEALEQPGLTPQQRIWHVVHTFKQRCQLLDR